jgi:hypothetical protein
VIDPGLGRPLDGEIHVDRIHILARPFATVALNDGGVGSIRQIVPGALGKNGIELDREHMSLCTHELGQKRRVVARSRTDMGHAFALAQGQGMQAAGMEGRAAVVDAVFRREGEERVLIEHRRVVRCDGLVASWPARHQPGRRAEEALARNGGEGLFESGIVRNA